MTKVRYDSIGKFIRGNALALSLQVVSVAVLVANLWLATKLAPLAQDINRVADRVDAIETTGAENAPLIPRFYQLEQHTKDIDTTLGRIETKLDRVIERTVTTTTNSQSTSVSRPSN